MRPLWNVVKAMRPKMFFEVILDKVILDKAILIQAIEVGPSLLKLSLLKPC